MFFIDYYWFGDDSRNQKIQKVFNVQSRVKMSRNETKYIESIRRAFIHTVRVWPHKWDPFGFCFKIFRKGNIHTKLIREFRSIQFCRRTLLFITKRCWSLSNGEKKSNRAWSISIRFLEKRRLCLCVCARQPNEPNLGQTNGTFYR